MEAIKFDPDTQRKFYKESFKKECFKKDTGEGEDKSIGSFYTLIAR